jgi:phage shock protein PspC (stress-responsive transcriptional regulator)
MKSSFYKGRMYRDGNRGVISGVCAGVASHFSVDAVYVRVAAIAGLIMLPTLFILGYFVAVLLVPKS